MCIARRPGLWLACFFTLAVLGANPDNLHAAHGISIDGKLKYPAGFVHFDYVSPQAVKGGQLLLHDLGSFDKMNPFTLKGTAPAGLEDLVFETLTVPSLDEPFAAYGLIAKDIEVARDRLSVTFTINEQARFSDGTPITAADVKFSLDTLKSGKAHPFYQAYLQDITGADILDPMRVRMNFARANRELHMIAGQLPIFSSKFYRATPFDAASLAPPIASGPYVVKEVVPGKTITYQRNPNYWARNLNVRRGFFNFDTITYKYYKDQIVALEAFKAGEFDFFKEYSARAWSRQHAGTKWDDGRIRKKAFKTATGQGLQAYILNLRRPLFQDRRVREALGLTYDFDTLNKSGQYQRSHSLFNNAEFAAEGLPSAGELRLLEPFRAQVPPEVFGPPFRAPLTGREPSRLRANLLRARALLAQAGWTVAADGQLRNTAGQAFTFEYMLPGEPRPFPEWEKNLAKLGIKLTMRAVDFALYRRRLEAYDFDVVAIAGNDFTLPDPAGLSQMLGSASVDEPGGNNLRGVKSPVVDALLKALAAADTLPALRDAARALDRVVMWNHWQIPDLWTADERVSYWNRFAMPAVQPLHFSIDTGALPWPLVTWWHKPGSVR